MVKTGLKLSHSGRSKYDHCSEMYNLHYIQRIRPAGTTSALVFGSAIDKAAENYLLEGNRDHAINIFKLDWNKLQEQSHTEVEFHVNDFDHELINQSDNESIIKDTVYATASDLVEAGENKERIKLANWYSLYRKGLILIDAFMNWVDNNVEEVLETQSEVELVDDNGDEIIGKPDAVLKMKGYEAPLLTDFKTSARYYERDSVKKSEQLSIYFFYLTNTRYPTMKRSAYLVLSKNIKKNRVKTCLKCGAVTEGREAACAEKVDGFTAKTNKPTKVRCNGDFSVVINPEASIQFINDAIPQQMIDDTIAKFATAIARINEGDFEKNLDGCANYYGRPCPYFNYCHNDRDMTGLIKKEEKCLTKETTVELDPPVE